MHFHPFRPILPRVCSALAGLLLVACPTQAAKPRALNVRDFGAKGDDTAKDTAAFQAALDSAGKQAGGGVVDVPPGIYLIGSVVMPAHVTLNVRAGATVLGSDDPADYPLIAGRWEGLMHTVRRALISADHADGIALTGEGLVQGGPTVGSGRDPRGPVLFEPVACRGVTVRGVTVRNYGVWTLHPTFCEDLTVSKVTFDTKGRNSDGLDPDSCRHIRIENCTFSDGDDNISLKSGKGLEGQTVGRPCEDVVIKGCTFLAGHGGVALGSEVSGGVRGVRILRCTFKGGDVEAIVIKSAAGRGGFVEDVTADGLTVTGTNLLVVNTLYRSNPDSQPVPGPAGLTPIRDIHISHVRADAKTLVSVVGFPELPLDGLTLTNITGTCAQAMTIRNATHVRLDRIFVKGYTGPRLATENASGAGLGGAAPYTPLR